MTHEDTDLRGLTSLLGSLDGKGYGAYKRLGGRWSFLRFTLHVDHVQGDPYATPTRLRALVPADVASFPEDLFRNRSRATGTASHLARCFGVAASDASTRAGSGKSGLLTIDAPGQAVLETTALRLGSDGSIEVRFQVGLPARGRRILGSRAVEILTQRVPDLVEGTCLASAHDPEVLRRHADANEDADALRTQVVERGWVSFVADGSHLPRRSGIDDRPLGTEQTVLFESPPTLRETLSAPNAGTVPGMAIRRGVTTITGGGYHGKSTLLAAVAAGVHNHRPGDGRERVVTDPGAVRIRAEDGRSVVGVDISGFIGPLPGGADTTDFSTPNASGSTSQAAATAEALEVGASALLIDEDTAATNFMVRDRRMQSLVPREAEPITPFIDRVRELWTRHGVSTILVIGGSGDYLEVSDTVIGLRDFEARDWTERAGEVVREHPTGRATEEATPLALPTPRRLLARSIDPSRGRRAIRTRSRGIHTLEFGESTIDLSALEQLVAPGQTRAIGLALVLLRDHLSRGSGHLSDALDAVESTLRTEGLDALSDRVPGDLAEFRRFELAAAVNRLRALEATPAPSPLPTDPNDGNFS